MKRLVCQKMLIGTLSCFDVVDKFLIDLFVKTWDVLKNVFKLSCFHKQAH